MIQPITTSHKYSHNVPAVSAGAGAVTASVRWPGIFLAGPRTEIGPGLAACRLATLLEPEHGN